MQSKALGMFVRWPGSESFFESTQVLLINTLAIHDLAMFCLLRERPERISAKHAPETAHSVDNSSIKWNRLPCINSFNASVVL